jgi:ParB-like nuclease family protein
MDVIANANPAYVRDDPRSDKASFEKLAYDMEDRALLVPILVLPDYKIIDGARRFEAAKALGWEDIPAIATNQWETIRDIFLKARKAEANGAPFLPMTWLEYAEVRRDILFPIYRHQVAIPNGIATRFHGQEPVGDAYMPDRAFGEMFGMDYMRARQINALAGALARVARRAPELHAQAVALAKATEAEGGTLSRPTAYAIDLVKETYEFKTTFDRKEAEAQLKALERSLPTLEGICQGMAQISPLNQAITEAEARDLSIRLSKASRHLTPLRQALQAILNQGREPDE